MLSTRGRQGMMVRGERRWCYHLTMKTFLGAKKLYLQHHLRFKGDLSQPRPCHLETHSECDHSSGHFFLRRANPPSLFPCTAMSCLVVLLRVTQILCRFMGTLVVNAATTATSRRRSSSVIKNSWLTEWRTEVSFHWFPFRLRPAALPPFPCWIM